MTLSVLLDPGHGGDDRGAQAGGADEATRNLALAIALHNTLAPLRESTCKDRRLFDIHLSRWEDNALSLTQRAERSHDCNADLVVSIHHDAHSDPRLNGSSLFVQDGDMIAFAVAEAIQLEMPRDLASPRLWRVSEEQSSADRWLQRPRNVLEQHGCPAVLLECGFLTNPDNAFYLARPVSEALVAVSVARGLLEWAQDMDLR